MNFFLFERKKLQKRSKNLAGLSLIDFESLLSRSPIAYYPAQRTRLKVGFRPISRNLCRRNGFISDVLALITKSACRTVWANENTMLWCFRAAIRHKARSIRSRACLARDTTMRLLRMFRRDVPEVKPPEGCINSGFSKYALACFGVLELVYAKSVRGADCTTYENPHKRSTCKVAVFFWYFSCPTRKVHVPFFLK